MMGCESMGKKAEDKSGKQFGDYYIVDRNYDKDYHTAHYNYVCKCGTDGIIDVRKIKDDLKCEHHLVCRICGKPASEDSHFYPKQKLCNRHYLQLHKYGKILNSEQEREFAKIKKCDICGDEHHDRYYIWKKDDEYSGKTLCGKHYNQINTKGRIIDPSPSNHRSRKIWSEEDENILREMYLNEASIKEIADYFNISTGAVSSKVCDIGVNKEFIKPNNPNFKAVYQDYDWCYERYINRGMTMQEMADEAEASLRVIQKWCQEVHNLDNRSYKEHKHLNDLQKQIIMFGRLGDGHIDNRENEPLYIESHAENQKDYIFWKWSILKDLCTQPPVYYPPKVKYFGDKGYNCQASYRLCTRIINDLKDIRAMNRSDIINQLNKLGLSTHILDDGYRKSSGWEICLAEWTDDEVQQYLNVCQNKFGIIGKRRKDKRYVSFNTKDSKTIDNIILSIIPNDLDIIKYKILNKQSVPMNYMGEVACQTL